MRCEGWQRKLNEYILESQEKYKKTGLVFGEFDCCLYAANWVRLLTGIDPMEDYRGRYSSKDEAFDMLAEKEGTLLDALTARFGQPVNIAKAMRGDIALSENDQALGIFFTSGSSMKALLLGKNGFSLHSAKECDYAFRVE